jgi:hypothetical protein
VASRTRRTFHSVWYLPEENTWRDLNLLAFRDVGTLTILENSLLFDGAKERVKSKNIREISFGKQGRDFFNNWVKVEYGKGKSAFFADGSWLGWGGIFGGTRKILDSMEHLRPS